MGGCHTKRPNHVKVVLARGSSRGEGQRGGGARPVVWKQGKLDGQAGLPREGIGIGGGKSGGRRRVRGEGPQPETPQNTPGWKKG